MSYSIEAATADCYPGTTCLVNKLGIQDEVRLAETEATVVLGRASLLDQEPIPGVFDFTHYRAIHHFLFCDLYDWAGQIRTINISKKELFLSLLLRSSHALMCVLPGWPNLPARDFLVRNSSKKLRIFTIL